MKTEVYGLVIAPTRELAKQIYEIAVDIGKNIPENPYTITLCIGGATTKLDVERIKDHGANLMIATPGKLKELMELKEIEHLLGFKHLEILIMGKQANTQAHNSFYPLPPNNSLFFLPPLTSLQQQRQRQ